LVLCGELPLEIAGKKAALAGSRVADQHNLELGLSASPLALTH
jgi:hypothetical protein